MGLNLAEIQQKLDRLIQNMSEQNRRAYQIFYDPNPQDVTLPQLDENGNLVNVTIPNRAKIKEAIWRDAQSAMNKVLYIDAEGGSDSNDGSFNTPLKTIKQAVNNIPPGGIGVIVLKNGQTHYMPSDGDITILNKTVLFIAWDFDSQDVNYSTTNPAKIFITKKSDGTASKFLLAGTSAIGFGRWGYGIHIEDDPDLPLNEPFIYGHVDTVPNTGNELGYKKLSIAHSVIKLNKCKLILHPEYVVLRFSKILMDRSDTNHHLLDCGFGSLRLEVDTTILSDLNGNNVNWSDVIEGIVRDNNSNPRNFVSNIVI